MSDKRQHYLVSSGYDFAMVSILPWADGRVSRNGLAVYTVLAIHAKRTTGRSWPGLRTIGAEARIDKDVAQAATRELAELGYITKEPTRRGHSTVYVLLAAPSSAIPNEQLIRSVPLDDELRAAIEGNESVPVTGTPENGDQTPRPSHGDTVSLSDGHSVPPTGTELEREREEASPEVATGSPDGSRPVAHLQPETGNTGELPQLRRKTKEGDREYAQRREHERKVHAGLNDGNRCPGCDMDLTALLGQLLEDEDSCHRCGYYFSGPRKGQVDRQIGSPPELMKQMRQSRQGEEPDNGTDVATDQESPEAVAGAEAATP